MSKYVCRYCKKEYKTKNSMNSHIGKSHDVSGKPQMFKPSPDMLKALEASFDMETKPTVTAFMDKAGVDRKQWYRWSDRPEFVAWWNDMWEKFMRNSVYNLDKISYMKAAKDFRYMELLQTKYAKYKKQPETQVNVDVNVNLQQKEAAERLADELISTERTSE